jgi:hypothetical protein
MRPYDEQRIQKRDRKREKRRLERERKAQQDEERRRIEALYWPWPYVADNQDPEVQERGR